MWKAVIIFMAVYTGLIISDRFRPVIAWIGICAALVLGSLSFHELFFGVNWNVIGIFVGSLILARLFSYSNLPETISDHLINRSPNLCVAFLAIIVFASVFSIFMDNVVTVLVVAPIALHLASKAGVSPVPVIIGVAISSNLQGMAILIGDTPSMILAAQTRMTFVDFFWYTGSSFAGGKPGIFWIVQLGAVAGFAVLLFFLRKDRQKPSHLEVTPVRSWVPVWLIALAIVLLSFATVFDPGFRWFGGVACISIGAAGFAWHKVRERRPGGKLKWKLDWGTVFFLMAVFILVHMLVERGAIAALVGRLEWLKGRNPFLIFSIIVWFSVLVSAFIDNVPYIAAMLPVVIGLSATVGVHPELLTLGVLIGSCMGGNITPIGAAANIVAIGILGDEGESVSFLDFMKIGLPFTIAATGVSWLALWFIFR